MICPDYLIIIVADISREKEIETALEESNQLLEAVIEELPAMIFLKRWQICASCVSIGG